MRFGFLFLLVFLCAISNAQVISPDEMFSKYDLQSINTDHFYEQSSMRSNEKIYISIDKWNLELEHSGILSDDYRFIDEKGNEITSKADRPIPMQGYTTNGGRVSITVAKGFLYGTIEDGKELFYIEPSRYYSKTSNEDEVIIYNTKDVKSTAPIKCGVEVAAEKGINPNEKDTGSRAGLCYDVEYAIVNDWSMYDEYGAGGLEARNIGITNDVITNYDDEFADGINFVITGQYNSTCSTCNPFTVTTDLGNTLDNFVSWGNSQLSNQNNSFYIRYDVASFWSDVFANSGTVGLAYVGQICTNYRYNVLSDLTSPNSTDEQNATKLRVLTAHELGHNFGAGHDGSGSGFIMAPSVNATDTWSSASISAINSHISSRNCLETCANSPATVFFSGSGGTVLEGDGSGIGGSCLEDYIDYSIPVSISKYPSSNVVVSVNSNGSTATNTYDFQLLTTSLTFTPTGALSQNVIVRVYDDAIVESPEEIQLNLFLISGPAEISTTNTQSITINSEDFIESAGGEGGYFLYGPSFTNITNDGFFSGNRTDSRSRFILTASYLQSIGMFAGEIDMLGLYVYIKGSNGVYNDFRIGMKSTLNSDLSNVSWGGTQQVFIGDVTTLEGEFTNMEFTTAYDWDGTSNIYVETCFNNSTIIGLDQVALFSTGESSGAQNMSWSTNTLDNCGFVSSWTYSLDLQPNVLLRRRGSTEAETVASSDANGRIRAGETANMFSDNGRIIASIKNTGSTSLQCIDASISTAGLGKQILPSGGEYSDKTFQIETGNSGTYELTLYYTEEELATWGSENLTLDFIKSSVPIANSNAGNAETLTTSTVNTDVGADNIIAYTTTTSGPGYFALSNATVEAQVFANVTSTFDAGDVVIEELGKGVLIKNAEGTQYLVKVNSSGVITVTENNSLVANSYLPAGDLCIISPSKALMIKRSASSYTRINVDNNGAIAVSNTASLPSQRITQTQGHFGLMENGAGIIFQNSENECYKLYINVNGEVRVGQVSCPN
ncbi:M12 family metallo-peptidase [Portibacter lacus]|uniref:Peptidase M12B domain-containing protein n=1 Tax=Portibacter lacus TaxID=1099794 RepID=A0AA37WBY9_9BACT|nr:M12 family metallo-peptidase [Portibacter lacus]GLR15911.1 hypothetical protein GCM10007940_05260 [Portibacter lacus]